MEDHAQPQERLVQPFKQQPQQKQNIEEELQGEQRLVQSLQQL
jgi:hypothetical protein